MSEGQAFRNAVTAHLPPKMANGEIVALCADIICAYLERHKDRSTAALHLVHEIENRRKA
jgi:hypothetical protein